MASCAEKHHLYAGKCPYCHRKLPSILDYSGLQIIADKSVPKDEIQFHHPDGRVDRFKVDCDS